MPRAVTPIPPPVSGMRAVPTPLPSTNSDLDETQAGDRSSGDVETSTQRRNVLLAATLAGLVLALVLAHFSH